MLYLVPGPYAFRSRGLNCFPYTGLEQAWETVDPGSANILGFCVSGPGVLGWMDRDLDLRALDTPNMSKWVKIPYFTPFPGVVFALSPLWRVPKRGINGIDNPITRAREGLIRGSDPEIWTPGIWTQDLDPRIWTPGGPRFDPILDPSEVHIWGG